VTPFPRAFEVVARGAPREASAPLVQARPGRGEIAIARVARGRSVVTRAYATSPVRLLTPTNHGHAAWVYASSYGGGLVDGDQVAMDIDIGAGATGYVSTQASTKVYRSFRGTEATLEARVGDAGLLVLAPDPVVCYAGSRYRQVQRVHVHAHGGLVLVDWVTSGRRMAGERWRFDEYSAQTEVRVGDALALYDTLALHASHGDLAARMGRFDVLALVVLAGTAVASITSDVLRAVQARPLRRRADLLVSAAPLRAPGCAVRLAGRSVEDVGSAVSELLAAIPERLGDDPWSRKW
jgi:urease accessory protein